MAADFETFSLYHRLLRNEERRRHHVYLRQPRQGEWYEYTWGDTLHQARQVAAFLKELGLKRGDRIGLISKNCAEWVIVDFGIVLAGMVSVPLFPNQHKDSLEFVLAHAEVRLVFIGKLDHHEQVRANIPESYPLVNMGYHEDLQTKYLWSDVIACNPSYDIVEPKPDELYTIIYTSGTSGMPKGAAYNHQTIANYLAVIKEDVYRIRRLDYYRLMSYLPLAHVYERTAIELSSIMLPSSLSFVESLETFVLNLQDVEPTFFTAVPRIWGVFQEKIEHKIKPGLLKVLLHIPVIAWLIKKRVRESLGFIHCTNFFSGASHLPVPVLKFFDKLGIKIQEGYGQSENMAYATLSMLGERRNGYVGSPRLGVQIKKSSDGELLIKSDCLMTCYYKEEQKTKDTFTEDGWLRTGDIVDIDKKQRVKILGRISENFKNQKGEFIAPTPIEKKFAVNSLVDQLCLVGQSLPNNVMLVSLSALAKAKSKSDITASLQNTLHEVNNQLANYEKIAHVLVVKGDWTAENGFLTPTMKVRRKEVEARYHDFIHASMVMDHHMVIWQ